MKFIQSPGVYTRATGYAAGALCAGRVVWRQPQFRHADGLPDQYFADECRRLQVQRFRARWPTVGRRFVDHIDPGAGVGLWNVEFKNKQRRHIRIMSTASPQTEVIRTGPYPELTWAAILIGYFLGTLILAFLIEGSELAAASTDSQLPVVSRITENGTE